METLIPILIKAALLTIVKTENSPDDGIEGVGIDLLF